MNKTELKAIKASIENTKIDLLEAIELSKTASMMSVICKVKSAVFNNVKTLNLINKLEKKK